jgi:peptidoglycan/LPS O-acetylase OafA/YrhL
MFNPVVIFLIIQVFAKYNWQNYFLFLLVVHAALAAVTFLSYKYFELPFLALKEKYAVIKSGDPGKEPVKETELEPAVEIVQAQSIPLNTNDTNPLP